MKPIQKAAKAVKPLSERLDDLEQSLSRTQYLGGQKASTLDKEAIEEIEAADQSEVRSLITPMILPNLFAWYAMVSKINPETRAKWPKMKVPAQAKDY